MLGFRPWILLLVPAIALGCKQKTEAHPKPYSCDGANCVIKPPTGGGGGVGNDGGAGAAGASAGAAGAAGTPASGVDVTGVIGSFTDDTFEPTTTFLDTATVQMLGPTGVAVEGHYDGQTFTVQGAALGQAVWTTIIPSIGSTLATVEPVDTTTGQSVTLDVIPADTIDQIYLLKTIPATRASGAAAVVLRFVDSTQLEPVTGVAITDPNVEVMYDSAGSWSDNATGTGPLGFAVLVNVAAIVDGSIQKFDYTAPSVPAPGAAVDIYVVPDSATIAQVVVSP